MPLPDIFEGQCCKDVQAFPVKFWALSVKEQGVFVSAAASTWHFCSSFDKKSVSIEQHCLGDTEEQNYWAGSVFLDGTEQAQQRVPGKSGFESNDDKMSSTANPTSL